MSYNISINDAGTCQPIDPTKVQIIDGKIIVTFSNGSVRQDYLPNIELTGFVTKTEFENHKHTLADITDFDPTIFATAAQGVKADSALQPGANVSALLNDAGYLTSADLIGTNDGLQNHLQDFNNPHQVTKAQVGLGNVDNTSDVAKPVSTAQQTEINNKYNAAISYINSKLSQKVDKVAGSRLMTEIEGNKLAEFDERHYRRPVADLTALTALNQAGLYDNERRYVATEGKDYFYDAEAVAGDAAPADQVGGTGFWKTTTASSTGGYTQWRLSTEGTFRKNMVDGSILDMRAVGLLSVAYTSEGIVTYSTTATKNRPDSELLDRSNHTGEQAISTITNLQKTLDEIVIPISKVDYEALRLAGEDKPGTLYLIPCE